MPFPQHVLLHVIVQLLPCHLLGSTINAGVHLKLTRLHDIIVLLLQVLHFEPNTTYGAGPGLV